MDASSLNGFFYNLVPGSLFILTLIYYKIIEIPSLDLNHNEGLYVLLFIIFGLFFGFLFQSLIKLLRLFLDNITIWFVSEHNKADFAIAKRDFRRDSSVGMFHKIDNMLRDKNSLIKHFSSRLAFWSNIFVAILVILALESYLKKNTPIDFYLQCLLLWSAWNYLFHQYSYHDTILKTYIVRNKK